MTETEWKDDFPGMIGTYRTRHRSTSVHGGYIEEELQVHLTFARGGGKTFRYYRPETEEVGDVADLEHYEWKGPETI